MKNLYQLTTFVTVLDEGSMTAAADKLYLTQPAVSQQIRNLEQDLGVELMVRGVRQIKATPQGEMLYEYSKKIIHLAQQAEIAIKAIGNQMRGHLRVGTLNSIGLQLMSPIVARLMRHNPELMLKFEYGRGDDLIKTFKKSNLDIIILPEIKTQYAAEFENCEEKFLLKEEMWLVGSSKDEKLPLQILTKDLGNFPLVNFTDEFPNFNQALLEKINGSVSFSKNVGEAHQRSEPNCIFESSNVGTLKRVIESGLGWGFLPAHSIKKQVRSGRLRRVYVKDFHYELDLICYYKKNSAAKPLIEVFYKTLSQHEKE